MKIAKIIETKENMPFDLDYFLVSRGLIQASSGGGKSYLIRKLLEETHGKVQQIVLDSEGEYSTLRETYDYLLIGKGKDVDVQVDIRSAEMIANKVLELRVSVIIDLYELKSHERKIFVRRFLEALVNIKKKLWHSVLVLLDEGDVYAPEKSAGKAESLQSVSDLASRGRKRGQCLVVATQRIAKLNKDVTAELKNKFVGNATQDIDRERAGKELGFTKKEDILGLRNLDTGEFFCFGPAISKEIIKVKINKVKTTHPEAGKRVGFKLTPPTKKIKAMLSKLTDLPKKAEEELREKQDYIKKIRGLEAQLRQKPKPEADKKHMEYNEKRMESMRINSFNQGLKAEANNHKAHISDYEKRDRIYDHKLKSLANELKQFVAKCSKLLQVEVPKIDIKKTMPVVSKPPRNVVSKPPREILQTTKLPSDTYVNDEEKELTKSQLKILESLAKFKSVLEDVPKPMVSAYCGVSSKSSGYTNNLSRLRVEGYITYRKAKTVYLTEKGEGKVNITASPATTEELQQMWRNILSSSRTKILDVLIEIYPDQISKEELAERVGVSAISSGYSNNLSAMRVIELLDYPETGFVKATENLFLE